MYCTLVRHLLIELARIQTYTELWVESDFAVADLGGGALGASAPPAESMAKIS